MSRAMDNLIGQPICVEEDSSCCNVPPGMYSVTMPKLGGSIQTPLKPFKANEMHIARKEEEEEENNNKQKKKQEGGGEETRTKKKAKSNERRTYQIT